MKKSILLLFAALLPLVASAEKVEIDGIWYNLITKGKVAEVTSSDGTGYSGSITLPATVTHNGVEYSVTSIGYDAFSYCSSLTAITIPEGVTSIGSKAFYKCSSLTAITLPEGVTSIGDEAFRGCSSLTAITIPKGVTSIGDDAFYYCSSLERVTINCANVGNWFRGLSSLKEIVLGEGVTSIGDYAFRDCSNLTAINIPESVTSIGSYAFSGCSSLTAITIPESVTSIRSYAFSGCSSLTDINIPESVTSIGGSAFSGCSSLTAITLPESVTSIGYGAFWGCSSLTDITIPEGVTSIGSSTFYNCSSLTAITIPESVTSIGEYAFSGCRDLTSITLPEGVTSIGERAFKACSLLTTITLPEGVTSIGYDAFYECNSLNAVHISSIEAWCKISFDGNSSNPLYYAHNLYLNGELVTELVIPSSVTSIGSYAFSGCSSLTTITIPEGVTSIGGSAFDDCSSLTAITLPEGVTSIGDYAFYGCSSLTTIVLPESVKYIYNNAFANCPELTDVYCYAKSVRITDADVFDGSYIEYATLHVPAGALETYKSKAPWSSFGTIIALGASITEIILSESSATLTEGEDLTLTMTTNPENADRNLISWSSSNPSVATVDNTGKVIAIAPGTATITATANDGSGVSASCEVTVNELILGKCATPTISYVDGKVVFACDTDGAIVKSNIKENIAGDYNEMEVAFMPTYTITAYATKEKYENSDEVCLTICWVPCEENHEEGDGILTIPSKPVLISARDGVLTLSGLAEGTEVTLYTTDGTMVAHQQSSAGEATFTVDTNQVYLVHIGDKVVKIGM